MSRCPGVDGIGLTRRFKDRPEPPAVVLITLHDPAEIARTAHDAGADAVVSKRELGESAECILRALGARSDGPTDAGVRRRGSP